MMMTVIVTVIIIVETRTIMKLKGAVLDFNSFHHELTLKLTVTR